jgi:hypothetical protein
MKYKSIGSRTSEAPSTGAARKRYGTFRKTAAILEKLEEALYFTVMHGSAEILAHRNLTEIKVFGARLSLDYGSTSIMETL